MNSKIIFLLDSIDLFFECYSGVIIDIENILFIQTDEKFIFTDEGYAKLLQNGDINNHYQLNEN